jgi:hypothetical protein
VPAGAWSVTLYIRDDGALVLEGGQFVIAGELRGHRRRGNTPRAHDRLATRDRPHVLRRVRSHDAAKRPDAVGSARRRVRGSQEGAKLWVAHKPPQRQWWRTRRLWKLAMRSDVTPWELTAAPGGLELLGSANWEGWWPAPLQESGRSGYEKG